MKILHLTLKKKWFDMILSGEKSEEYREIKPYWEKRLLPVRYDVIEFRNGYGSKRPAFIIQYNNIKIGVGKEKWGAPRKQVFILSLGSVLAKFAKDLHKWKTRKN